MVIIVPDEIDGLDHVIENLVPIDTAGVLEVDLVEVDLYLPRFTVESSFDFNGLLQKVMIE